MGNVVPILTFKVKYILWLQISSGLWFLVPLFSPKDPSGSEVWLQHLADSLHVEGYGLLSRHALI